MTGEPKEVHYADCDGDCGGRCTQEWARDPLNEDRETQA